MNAVEEHSNGDRNTVPALELFDDVIVYADPDNPGRHVYLPLVPSPVLSASGKPSGQLIVAGETAFMMLSAQWDLPADRIERLRQQLACAAPSDGDPPASVRLSFAPVRQVAAALLVLPAGTVLAHSTTSGMPPWSALFNAKLDAAAHPAATAAFNGNEGHVAVEFTGELTARMAVSSTLEGDLAGIVDRATLQRALVDGRAMITFDPLAAAAFEGQLVDRLLAASRLSAPCAGTDTRIAVELAFDEPVPVRARADLGSWFAGSPAILPAGSTSKEGRKVG